MASRCDVWIYLRGQLSENILFAMRVYKGFWIEHYFLLLSKVSLEEYKKKISYYTCKV